MKLTPVESSHIAAIGYLEDERVLLVRYKDGSFYGYPGCYPEQFAAFLAAKSKGSWLGKWPCIGWNKAILISKGVMPTETEPLDAGIQVAGPGDNAAPSPGPLNEQRSHMQDAERVPQDQLAIIHGDNVLPTRLAESLGIAPLNVIDEDASACCRKAFAQITVDYSNAGAVTCGECMTQFRPHIMGTVRHWRIVPLFALHRNR
jgi:hypothetical protein